MHYHAEIWIPDDVDWIQLETLINDTMAPYNKNFHDNGWWDWWQVGGRYSGRHQPGYNPEDDPRNIEDCKVCDGSGFRRDAIGNDARDKDPSYTCNGCGVFDPGLGKWRHSKQGPGKSVKWPTQWVSIVRSSISATETTLRWNVSPKPWPPTLSIRSRP